MTESFWSGLGAIATMLISLVFVLFLAWYLLRWMGKKMPSAGQGGSIQVLDRLNVGREKSLLLVKAGEKTLLIGMSENAVNTLCEFDADTVFLPKEMPKGMDFSALLQDAVKNVPLKRRHEEEKPNEE